MLRHHESRLRRLEEQDPDASPAWQEVALQIQYEGIDGGPPQMGDRYVVRVPVAQLRRRWCQEGGYDEES
jgi:hypothetical protein